MYLNESVSLCLKLFLYRMIYIEIQFNTPIIITYLILTIELSGIHLTFFYEIY